MSTSLFLILAVTGPQAGPADDGAVSASPAVDRRVIESEGRAADDGDLLHRVQFRSYYGGSYYFGIPYYGSQFNYVPFTVYPYYTIQTPGYYAPGYMEWGFRYGATPYTWRSYGRGYYGPYYGSPYSGRRGGFWRWY